MFAVYLFGYPVSLGDGGADTNRCRMFALLVVRTNKVREFKYAKVDASVLLGFPAGIASFRVVCVSASLMIEQHKKQ